MEENRALSKWLFRLLVVHIVSIAYSALTHVVNFGQWNDWLKLIFSAGVIFCLFPMGKNHTLYRAAAAVLCAELICSVIRIVFNTHTVIQMLYDIFENDTFRVMADVNNIFHVILLVCSLSAVLFEYIGHSRVVNTVDLRLYKCWIVAAIATLAFSVLMYILSSILMAMIQNETLNYDLYQQIQPILSLPGLLVKIFYMICLFKSGQVLAQVKDPTG